LLVAACGGDDDETPGDDQATGNVSLEICVAPRDVQVAAGKSFSPEATDETLADLVRGAVAATYRGQIAALKNAEVDAATQGDVDTITTAMEEGVEQLESDPSLLRSGEVPAFEEAAELADEAGFAECSSAGNPAG